jgi:hypothetical protein
MPNDGFHLNGITWSGPLYNTYVKQRLCHRQRQAYMDAVVNSCPLKLPDPEVRSAASTMRSKHI